MTTELVDTVVIAPESVDPVVVLVSDSDITDSSVVSVEARGELSDPVVVTPVVTRDNSGVDVTIDSVRGLSAETKEVGNSEVNMTKMITVLIAFLENRENIETRR
jgi:hypothetical protein